MRTRQRLGRHLAGCTGASHGHLVVAGRYHRPMAVAAYLRVYLPAERVDDPLAHVAVPGPGSRPVLTNGVYGMWEESVRDDAFVIEMENGRFVCPRHPRLRMLEGLLAFRNAYRGPTASALVPEAIAERAGRELARIHDRFPGVRSHILTSPFFVPLRWFSAFDPTERELVDDGVVTVRYRTRVRDALRRLRDAVEILDEAGFDETIVDQVADVVDWLEPFSGDAVLELDYGPVAGLFSPADLAVDDTAADVHASLAALADGDYERAGEHYSAAASRWAHAQSLVYVN